jgi:glycosyltransferase involved in cell wall biosynthesis
MKPCLSIIICTHNPKFEYLNRVLKALKEQTLSMEKWELLAIDNASSQPLCDRVDLSWHPHARHIREEKLGLTWARLRGISESQAEVLIFVDDDNVLDSDYLENAAKIGERWPILGAWGGQAVPEFEERPPEWTQPFWSKLAIREFDRDKWSNLIGQDENTPYGAGLCVRKSVAQAYAQVIERDPRRAKLGRTGKALSACEDVDLAYTACDIGLGTGIFTALKLTHLIPPNRLQEEYLLRLIEGLTYSVAVLESFRGNSLPTYSWRSKLLNYLRRWSLDARGRRFNDAHFRGLNLAIKELSEVSIGNEPT